MSFYKLSDGSKPEGSEKANMESFVLIPEGTIANAKIIKAELAEPNQYESKPKYTVEYELIDGEFKQMRVRQNIKAFEDDPKKRDRGVDMLVRIMNICGYTPKHSDAPSTNDLLPLTKCRIQVKIGQWDKDGNYGNFVRGVYEKDANEIQTGVLKDPSTRNQNDKPDQKLLDEFDDSIPF